MAFNVINLKHREIQEGWLHLKEADGQLAYADEEKTKPIRLKMKSIHSDSFRKAFFKMNVRLSRLKDSKQKDFESMSKSKQELSKDQLEAELIEVFMQGEEMAIDLICEMAIGWEGFVNEDGEALEFKPEYLKMFISDLNNYHVFQQVRDSLRDQSDFMEA